VGTAISHLLAAAFLAVSIVFVYRSFYGMRIGVAQAESGRVSGATPAASRSTP
jgi:hypothetical protein